MTVPNIITTIRIILAPIFIIYLIEGNFFSALIVFVICGISDGLDGLVARLFNQKSKTGAYLDPIADKIILSSAFVALFINGSLPGWLAVSVITRDIFITIGVFVILLNKVELKIRPSIFSKITTCLQFITLSFILLRPFYPLNPLWYQTLYYFTAGFTVISGLHYIHYWFKMMGEAMDHNNS